MKFLSTLFSKSDIDLDNVMVGAVEADLANIEDMAKEDRPVTAIKAYGDTLSAARRNLAARYETLETQRALIDKEMDDITTLCDALEQSLRTIGALPPSVPDAEPVALDLVA